MNRYLSASAARAELPKLIQDVADGDQIVMTRHGVPAAVLIGVEQLETLKMVARLWQDPEAVRAMRDADADVERGRVIKGTRLPTVSKLLAKARKDGILAAPGG